MTLLLTEQDVLRSVGMEDAIAAVEDLFCHWEDSVNPPRIRLFMPTCSLHLLGAALPYRNRMGAKVYSIAAGWTLRFIFLLFDMQTGSLLALMEADALGRLRTGAASGVATKKLMPPMSERLCVVGTGSQAWTQALAAAAVMHPKEVFVYSPNAEHRRTFAEKLAGVVSAKVLAIDDLREYASQSDVIVTATTSATPVIFGDWLKPGCHINCAGSNQPTKREIDDAVVERADLIVVDHTEQAKTECGDLLPAVSRGIISWDDVALLRDVANGSVIRKAADDITLFSSLGVAAEDVALASIVYDRAVERGIGTSLPFGQVLAGGPLE